MITRESGLDQDEVYTPKQAGIRMGEFLIPAQPQSALLSLSCMVPGEFPNCYGSDIVGVGDPTSSISYQSLAAHDLSWLAASQFARDHIVESW